jgi:hypothetical protein
MKHATLFRALAAALLLPVAVLAQASVQQSLDPRSTFLRTDPNDTGLPPTFYFDLQQLGIVPGSTIRIRTVGAFFWHPPQPLQGVNAVAVFSTTATPLPASNPDRLPNALSCNAPPYPTAPTYFQTLPTDIPEDFFVDQAGVRVTVPTGTGGNAPFLLIGADDVFWNDNTSASFGVLLEALDRRYLLRILCLDSTRSVACGTSSFSFPTSAQLAAARAELLSKQNFGLGAPVTREVQLAITSQITATSLLDIDLVLLNPLFGDPTLSSCELATLKDFVEQGGGVFTFENTASAHIRSIIGLPAGLICGNGTISASAGTHPVLIGPFGSVGGLPNVYRCSMPAPLPVGVPLLQDANGTVAAAFTVGAGNILVVNEEEFLMNSGGCPAAPSWSTGSPKRLLLNGIAWAAPGSTFAYAPGATYCYFGQGCAGSNGIPELTSSSVPTIGSLFSVNVVNLPLAGGLAVMVIGFSDVSWGAISLPIDLTPVGMTGCTSYVSVDITDPLPHTSGVAQWVLSIPPNPAIAGVEFFNQALSFDPAAGNPFGAVVSNAAKATVR